MSWGDFVKPVRLGKLATPEAEALARSLVEAETLPASPELVDGLIQADSAHNPTSTEEGTLLGSVGSVVET